MSNTSKAMEDNTPAPPARKKSQVNGKQGAMKSRAKPTAKTTASSKPPPSKSGASKKPTQKPLVSQASEIPAQDIVQRGLLTSSDPIAVPKSSRKKKKKNKKTGKLLPPNDGADKNVNSSNSANTTNVFGPSGESSADDYFFVRVSEYPPLYDSNELASPVKSLQFKLPPASAVIDGLKERASRFAARGDFLGAIGELSQILRMPELSSQTKIDTLQLRALMFRRNLQDNHAVEDDLELSRLRKAALLLNGPVTEVKRADTDSLASTQDQQAETDVNVGQLKASLRDYPAGITACSRALSAKPLHIPAKILRAFCYLRTGECELCISDVADVLSLKPQETKALLLQARALRHLGKLNEALELCTFVVQLHPTSVQPYYYRGLVQIRLGSRSSWSSAISDFQTVLELETDNVRARTALAHCYECICDYESSTLNLNHALEFKNKVDARRHARIIANRGVLYVLTNALSFALNDFAKAHRIQPLVSLYFQLKTFGDFWRDSGATVDLVICERIISSFRKMQSVGYLQNLVFTLKKTLSYGGHKEVLLVTTDDIDFDLVLYSYVSPLPNNPEINDSSSLSVFIPTATPSATKDTPPPHQSSAAFQKEIILISTCHHPNIIKPLGPPFLYNNQPTVAVEHHPGGTLTARLHSGHQLWPTRDTQFRYIRDMISAVCYLHTQHYPPIIHCDLKSDSFVFAADQRLVLTGFSSAILEQPESTTSGGAKSVSQSAATRIGPQTRVADMWALGRLILDVCVPPSTFKQEVANVLGQGRMPLLEQIIPDVVQRKLVEYCVTYAFLTASITAVSTSSSKSPSEIFFQMLHLCDSELQKKSRAPLRALTLAPVGARTFDDINNSVFHPLKRRLDITQVDDAIMDAVQLVLFALGFQKDLSLPSTPTDSDEKADSFEEYQDVDTDSTAKRNVGTSFVLPLHSEIQAIFDAMSWVHSALFESSPAVLERLRAELKEQTTNKDAETEADVPTAWPRFFATEIDVAHAPIALRTNANLILQRSGFPVIRNHQLRPSSSLASSATSPLPSSTNSVATASSEAYVFGQHNTVDMPDLEKAFSVIEELMCDQDMPPRSALTLVSEHEFDTVLQAALGPSMAVSSLNQLVPFSAGSFNFSTNSSTETKTD